MILGYNYSCKKCGRNMNTELFKSGLLVSNKPIKRMYEHICPECGTEYDCKVTVKLSVKMVEEEK